MEKSKPGRKTELPLQKMQRFAITLDKKTVEIAREMGDGSISKGIRKKFKDQAGGVVPPFEPETAG